MKFSFCLHVNYPASLFSLVLLSSSKKQLSTSEPLLHSTPLHSCTWCLSTSYMWHQVIPLALLSTHSPLLQPCCLQRWLVLSASASSGCPCRCHQTSVNLWIGWRVKCPGGWQSLPTTHQVPPAPAPRHSQPQTPVERRFTEPHLGAVGSMAPAPPWPHAMVSVCTHQTSSKIKPQYAGLRSHYWQGVQQDKLSKSPLRFQSVLETIQLLFSLSAPCRTDFEQSMPKEISCIPLKSRGQERLN